MSTKERYQNPVAGDDVRLRLFSYNANASTDFQSVEKVEVYFLDPTAVSAENPDGRTLFATVPGQSVNRADVGRYEFMLNLQRTNFVIGNYMDLWYVTVEEDDEIATLPNYFSVYPNMWYTSPIPVIYDFNFVFRPNKIRKGSKRYLIIEITPNVPRGSDITKYYENLSIISPLKISIEQACGDCLPQESELRMVLDKEPVELREKAVGYFFLDTEELDCGIYHVWFNMELGESVYVSDKQQLQIYN